MTRAARTYVPGRAQGAALVVAEPISFWGGVDAATGAVIDRLHPDLGARLAGRILVMEGGRGSCSSASVLAEAIRLGTAPAGIVLATPDPILSVGAMVARDLYGLACPVIVCPTDGIASGDRLGIDAPEGAAASLTGA